MKPLESDVTLIYRSELKENIQGNKFANIPDDLHEFLHKIDGTMQPIVENLYPNQDYIIEINIRSV